MPRSRDHFPPAMNNLEPEVLDKAIEIPNALLARGCEEGMAIRMGISRAGERARIDGLLSLLRGDNTAG
jgi:uncharacterized protein YdaT